MKKAKRSSSHSHLYLNVTYISYNLQTDIFRGKKKTKTTNHQKNLSIQTLYLNLHNFFLSLQNLQINVQSSWVNYTSSLNIHILRASKVIQAQDKIFSLYNHLFT